MKSWIGMTVIGALGLSFASGAAAQDISYPHEEARALANCIGLSTDGRDRILTAQWFATSIGSGSSMEGIVTVNPEARKATDAAMGALFMRIFTVDCRAEATPLFARGDTNGLQSAGGKLGQIAMAELMNDPLVREAMMGYMAHGDLAAVSAMAQ